VFQLLKPFSKLPLITAALAEVEKAKLPKPKRLITPAVECFKRVEIDMVAVRILRI
jgi:hypothetical protein